MLPKWLTRSLGNKHSCDWQQDRWPSRTCEVCNPWKAPETGAGAGRLGTTARTEDTAAPTLAVRSTWAVTRGRRETTTRGQGRARLLPGPPVLPTFLQ